MNCINIDVVMYSHVRTLVYDISIERNAFFIVCLYRYIINNKNTRRMDVSFIKLFFMNNEIPVHVVIRRIKIVVFLLVVFMLKIAEKNLLNRYASGIESNIVNILINILFSFVNICNKFIVKNLQKILFVHLSNCA